MNSITELFQKTLDEEKRLRQELIDIYINKWKNEYKLSKNVINTLTNEQKLRKRNEYESDGYIIEAEMIKVKEFIEDLEKLREVSTH